MKALLLCAGYGSRWQSYNQKHSKICIPFLNIPIVGYPLKILEDIGVRHIVMNTHHHAQQVQSEIQNLHISIPNQFFYYEEQILEGLGTLIQNQSSFKGEENIIYMNGDSIFLCDEFFQSMKEEHDRNNAFITFLVSPSSDSKVQRIWADGNYQIQNVGMTPEKSELKGYFFSGFCLIRSECFDLFKKTDRHLFRDFVSRYSSSCYVHVRKDLKFFEVGNLNSYLKATEKCLQYLFDEPSSKECSLLKKTISRFCPSFNRLEGSYYYSQTVFPEKPQEYVLCGSHVKGLEHLKIKNFAVIGNHVNIIKPSTIEGGVVGSYYSLNQSINQTLRL